MMEVTQLGFWDKPKRTIQYKQVGNVLMLGGGRQSSGLVEMSVEGELPRFDLVLFADTYDEPDYVYQQVNYLRSRLALVNTPLQVVTHKSGLGIVEYTKDLRLSRFAKMPLYVMAEDGTVSQLPRQCTKEFKVDPCDRAMREWLFGQGYARQQKNGLRVVPGVYVNVALGFGADESYRVNRKPFTVKWKRKAFPLYERGISTAKLMGWFEEKGLRVPKKSSCRICPYHDDQYWMEMSPPDFEAACGFDDFIRTPAAVKHFLKGIRERCYLHPSCTPLRDVDFKHWKQKRRFNPLQAELMLGSTCANDGGFSCMEA